MRWLVGVALVVTFLRVPDAAVAEEISLSSMVQSVQVALRDTQKKIERQNAPKLDTVTLNLKTVSKEEGEAGFTIYVVSLGGSGSSEVTSSVMIELVPPPADAPSNVSPAADITKALKDSIVAASNAIRVAQEGRPKLVSKSIEVSLAFVLQAEGSGGLKIIFPPFEAAAGGSMSRSEVQTITIVFK